MKQLVRHPVVVLATLVVAAMLPLAVAAGAQVGGIVTVSASRTLLAASGGTVTLTVRARGADRCTLDVARIVGDSEVQVLLRTSSCPGGQMEAQLSVPPDLLGVTERYSVLALASFASGEAHAWASVYVARPAPAVRWSPPAIHLGAAPVRFVQRGPAALLLLSRTEVPLAGGEVVASFSAPEASVCTLTSLPRLWEEQDPYPVKCVGDVVLTLPASSSTRPWTLTFRASGSSGTTTDSRVLTQAQQMTEQSGNWSGYVVQSSETGGAGYASGEWTVPRLDCAASQSGSSISVWVGLGGAVGTEPLLQTGVSDSCIDGVQQDTPWWEIVPMTPDYAEDFSDFSVSPGNVMEATCTRDTSGGWLTRLDDLTTGTSGWMITGEGWGVESDEASSFQDQGSTASVSFSPVSTAEWIVEAPTAAASGQIETMADYGLLVFTHLETDLPSPWSLTPDDGYEVVVGNSAVSAPSVPLGDGFWVTYDGRSGTS